VLIAWSFCPVRAEAQRRDSMRRIETAGAFRNKSYLSSISSGTRIPPARDRDKEVASGRFGFALRPEQRAKVLRTMRATLSRAAILLLLSVSLVGCKSGSNMFAWAKKKDGGDAPKYASSTNPVLPSASSDAAASSAANQQTPGQMAAAVTASTPSNNALGNYGATAQTSYPKTPYEPAKLGGAPAPSSSTPIGNTGINASGYANGGYGATAAAAAPQSYGTPASYGAPAATATASAQPQNGMYNSSYGAAPPAAAAPAQYAAAPAAATPAYRTADARSAMTGTAPAADPSAAQGGNMVGDRYAGAPAAAYVDPANSPAAMQPYTPPAASAPAAGVGDRYSQPAPAAADPAAYNPGATGYQPGNTGYNPPDVYAPAPPPAGATPARQDPGYRPGGTSNFTPSAAAKPAGTNEAPAGGVRPASYQSADAANGSQAWPPASSSTLPPSGSESYGAYQGASSTSEPAYSASTPVASAPGLFPTR
jgi:hypothetical protein